MHRSIVAGYLAGVALSGCVAHAGASWTTLAPGNRFNSRYPGLSTYTSVFTWHVAIGFIVGCYLIAANASNPQPGGLAGLRRHPLCTLGLLTNGASRAVCSAWWRPPVPWPGPDAAASPAPPWSGRSERPWPSSSSWASPPGSACVDIPTLNEYDRSFLNEKTRVESWRAGPREMLNHRRAPACPAAPTCTTTSPPDHAALPALESGAMARASPGSRQPWRWWATASGWWSEARRIGRGGDDRRLRVAGRPGGQHPSPHPRARSRAWPDRPAVPDRSDASVRGFRVRPLRLVQAPSAPSTPAAPTVLPGPAR